MKSWKHAQSSPHGAHRVIFIDLARALAVAFMLYGHTAERAAGSQLPGRALGRRLLGRRGVGALDGEIAKALPPGEFPIEDVPIDDPIFRSQFIVTKVPQITNIRFWRSTHGAETSERGEETRAAHFRGVRDHATARWS